MVTNSKKWTFNRNPVQCIGFPLKIHFFQFLYSYLWENRQTKYQKNSKNYENLEKNKKKWIFYGNPMQCIGFPLKIYFFNIYLFFIEKIQKNSKKKQIWKKIRKSGLSTKIRCSASDFRWKSIFSIFIYFFMGKIKTNSKTIQKIRKFSKK